MRGLNHGWGQDSIGSQHTPHDRHFFLPLLGLWTYLPLGPGNGVEDLLLPLGYLAISYGNVGGVCPFTKTDRHRFCPLFQAVLV